MSITKAQLFLVWIISLYYGKPYFVYQSFFRSDIYGKALGNVVIQVKVLNTDIDGWLSFFFFFFYIQL